MNLSRERLMQVGVGTLRLLLDDANRREDYHKQRKQEAITDQEHISDEADRRGVLL